MHDFNYIDFAVKEYVREAHDWARQDALGRRITASQAAPSRVSRLRGGLASALRRTADYLVSADVRTQQA